MVTNMNVIPGLVFLFHLDLHVEASVPYKVKSSKDSQKGKSSSEVRRTSTASLEARVKEGREDLHPEK